MKLIEGEEVQKYYNIDGNAAWKSDLTKCFRSPSGMSLQVYGNSYT